MKNCNCQKIGAGAAFLTEVSTSPPLSGDGTAGSPLKLLQSYNPQAGNYTLIATDAGKAVIMNNSTNDRALTFPPGIFTIGDKGFIWKTGTGEITGTKGSGVTLVTALTGNVNFKLDGVSPYKIEWEYTDTDEFTIYGNIKAV